MYILTTVILTTEAPSFTIFPEDVEVDEPLKPATFNCKADGTPPPQIKWYKDDLLILDSAKQEGSQFHITTEGALVFKGKRYHVTREGSLIIFDPRSEDEASYKCVAENGLGSVDYKVALFLDLSKRRRHAKLSNNIHRYVSLVARALDLYVEDGLSPGRTYNNCLRSF